jgi:hypothetical protein
VLDPKIEVRLRRFAEVSDGLDHALQTQAERTRSTRSVDEAFGEVDVVPGEAEEVGEAEAGVEGGGEEGAVAGEGGVEQARDLVVVEDALLAAVDAGAFVLFEAARRLSVMWPRRRACWRMRPSGTIAPLVVLAARPCARIRAISCAMSSVVISVRRLRPRAGRRCLSRW